MRLARDLLGPEREVFVSRALWVVSMGLLSACPSRGFDCASVAIRDADGVADPCDVQACQLCVDTCGGDCVILEIFPPVYSCGPDGSWDVYETCEDWELPGSTQASACEEVTSIVPADQVTPLGFSADQVLAAVVGPFGADAEWVAEKGRPATTVSLSVTAGTGEVLFHDLSAGYLAPSIGASPPCFDVLEVPARVEFTSGDGAFAEVREVSLMVSDLTAISASFPLDWATLDGTFTFATIDPTAWDEVTLDVSTQLVPSVSGEVQVSASRGAGSVSEGLVGPLLRWPPM